MASLYDLLAQAAPNPVVEVNRAIARGRASGPEAGLLILEPLAGEPVLASSPLLASVRGDLLERAGRTTRPRPSSGRRRPQPKRGRRTLPLRRAQENSPRPAPDED